MARHATTASGTRGVRPSRDVEGSHRTDRSHRRRCVALVAVVAVLGKMWWDSRLPDTYNVMSYGTHDYGGGPEPPDHEGHDAGAGTSVADLRGASYGAPDARFRLTARTADIRLSSGRVVHALTYNGTSPGPELRVQQGDLVEVVLRNADVDEGVTIHWHGIDVPNAEDGVAGVTQNAVLPGESLHVPLPRRAGRNVLVPHAPGLLEGGQARPLRRVRDRAARHRSPASTSRSPRTPTTASRR